MENTPLAMVSTCFNRVLILADQGPMNLAMMFLRFHYIQIDSPIYWAICHLNGVLPQLIQLGSAIFFGGVPSSKVIQEYMKKVEKSPFPLQMDLSWIFHRFYHGFAYETSPVSHSFAILAEEIQGFFPVQVPHLAGWRSAYWTAPSCCLDMPTRWIYSA